MIHRNLPFFLSVLFLTALPAAHAQDMPVEVYEFAWNQRGEKGEVVLTVGPGHVRVDQAARKFAAIASVDTGDITGLEIRDGTWWQFSWPKVRERVGASVAPSERLRDLSIPNAASVDLARPLARDFSDDTPRFMWKPTEETRTIAGHKCTKWEGASTDGEDLTVWVTEGDVPAITAAVAALEPIAQPLDLVVMRPALPRQYLTAVEGLAKANVTPLQVEWGPRGGKSSVTYQGHQQRKVNPDRVFLAPDSYRPVKLEAIEMLLATGDEEEKKDTPAARPLGDTPFPTPNHTFDF